jgi:4-oxalocrotonate tautomerase
MPIINLKVSKNFTSQELHSVVSEITNLTAKHLKKKPEVTAITVLPIEKTNWFINSNSLENLNQDSFYLDIKVTDGTNSKDEKSDYIKAIFTYMRTILENIHSESYVYVEEVKADAYGFGGFTQEYRYIKNQINN